MISKSSANLYHAYPASYFEKNDFCKFSFLQIICKKWVAQTCSLYQNDRVENCDILIYHTFKLIKNWESYEFLPFFSILGTLCGAPVSSSCISKNPATHKRWWRYVSGTPHVEIDFILWLWYDIWVLKYDMIWRARKCNWETNSCLKMDSSPAKKIRHL